MYIEKRGKKYRYSEEYRDKMTGKRKKVSVTLDGKSAKHKALAAEILTEKINNLEAECKTTNLTMDEFCNLYLDYKKQSVKANSFRRDVSAVKTILQIIGKDVLVDKLSAQYIKRQFGKSGKNNSTLNNLRTRLFALLNWGYENDYIDDISYIKKIKPYKDTPHRIKIEDKYLEQWELEKIVDFESIAHWKYLIQLMALSGLRFAEAAALNKSDVDIQNRVIHVTKSYDYVEDVCTSTKTQTSNRDIYMQEELLIVCKQINAEMNAVRLQKSIITDVFLFNTNTGKRLTYAAFNKRLKHTAKETIGREITPHTLRHTNASLLAENDIPVDVIRRRLGHSDSKITEEIYLHVTDTLHDKENKAVNQVRILK